MMFAPQKGKAYDKLPIKVEASFDTDVWFVSTKFDGNQIFITKISGRVRMFTSDWKEFYIREVANEVHKITGDFVIIGEFLHDSIGKLGDRTKCGVLTTYRTNFSKRLSNDAGSESKSLIKVFDMMFYDYKGQPSVNVPYLTRLEIASIHISYLNYLQVVVGGLMTGKQAKLHAKALVKLGWEGCMCVNPKSLYQPGKRVNYSIKLKYRKTADLRCINIEEGEGKYVGLIGALILVDSMGRTCNVGSGLTDADRSKDTSYFINRVIEIEYEQIIDTYIQPTFVCVREEKEID
jgi:ATP-dependent DNA ligase